MATQSTDIRIDEKVKAEATALFARFGLGLSDAVNVFLHVSIAEQGVPFPLKNRPSYPAATAEERRDALHKLFDLADRNPLPKGYTFNREACHDREVLHR